jgi:hypothetical protein
LQEADQNLKNGQGSAPRRHCCRNFPLSCHNLCVDRGAMMAYMPRAKYWISHASLRSTLGHLWLLPGFISRQRHPRYYRPGRMSFRWYRERPSLLWNWSWYCCKNIMAIVFEELLLPSPSYFFFFFFFSKFFKLLHWSVWATLHARTQKSQKPATVPCQFTVHYPFIFWMGGSVWVFLLASWFNCVHSGSIVVEALCYKPEGRGFETWWGEWVFSQFT